MALLQWQQIFLQLNSIVMKKMLALLSIFIVFQSHAQDAKMNAYISNLMSKMTLEEKIGQLNLVTPGGAVTGSVVSKDVDEKIRKGLVGGLFGITGPKKVRQAQKMAVESSRLHIPLLFGLDVIHGHKTIFPIPLGLSASWDTAMTERSARIAAREASADGLNWVFSPMVDIARDPRWGRIAEGSGEDPFLGSEIAKAMVRGYQGRDISADTTVMACVKHFALYGAAEAGREYNTADMSHIVMYNDYLPPYRAAVDAGVGSVMTSFNVVDRVPATVNKWLLTDLLRKQWGFNGLIVSDYTSLNEVTAHGLGDLQKVSALALKAGLDMDMVGEGFLTTLKQSLKEGKVTQKDIDDACRKVLEAKYKMGLFDDPYRYLDEERASKEIFTAENRQAAMEFAERSFVLLKNENQTLPLKKSGTIALVGPLTESQRNMLGTWSVSGDWQQSVSVATGIKNLIRNSAKIIYAKGANISDDTMLIKRVITLGEEIVSDPNKSPQQLLDEAIQAANSADIVVTAVGEAADMSGESSSRSDIGIPESQENMIKALVQTGKPVVLVVFSGRPLTLTWEDKHVAAILEVWFPGTEAGNAIANVLFGNYNPSGKLTATFPRSVGQIPLYYNHLNTGRPYEEGGPTKFKSDYLDITNDPLYPFGYGLSYTSFSYSDIKVNKTELTGDETLTATVTVTNTGQQAGEETVQLYISDPVASISRNVQDLKGFKKVILQPGESKDISFNINTDLLKFYNSDLNYTWEPGEFIIRIGTNSRDTKSV